MNIEFTPDELRIMRAHISGKYNPFASKVEDIDAMNSAISKAGKMVDELDAFDEMDAAGDLIKWAYEKYQTQRGVDAANE